MNFSMKDLATGYTIADKVSSEGVSEYPLKRIFDFVFASFALLMSLPLWFIFALAIKLEDGGPVLFRQNRWGKNKRQ